ncbi:MAG: hypothetical protein SF172_14325 [Burkholderiales bacterium]|nr:hypothetical protein [Burkholderiales bacterium]
MATTPLRWAVLACLLSLSTIATTFPSPSYAQAPAAARRSADASEAFFAANQLRASGQRIARLYLETGAGVRPNRTRVMLEQEIKSYEQLLDGLLRERNDKTLQKHVARVEEAWKELKPMVTSPFGRDRAELVYSLSEQLYIQTAKATTYLEDRAQSEAGYLSDVAGRNAAFAERIAKAAFLFSITRKSGSLVDFETWKKEYTDGYERLEKSELNDDYARANLRLGRMMWVMFDATLSEIIKKNDTTRMLDIAKSVDGMWEIAQSSKKQYEVMFRQQMKQGNQLASQPPQKGS